MRADKNVPKYHYSPSHNLQNYYIGSPSLNKPATPQKYISRSPNQSFSNNLYRIPSSDHTYTDPNPNYSRKTSNIQKFDISPRSQSNVQTPIKMETQYSADKYLNSNSKSKVNNQAATHKKPVEQLVNQQFLIKIKNLERNIADLTVKIQCINSQIIKFKQNEKQSSKESSRTNNISDTEIVSLYHPLSSQDSSVIKTQIATIKREIQQIRGKKQPEHMAEFRRNISGIIKETLNEVKASLYQEMLEIQVKINKLRKNDIAIFEEQLGVIQKQISHKIDFKINKIQTNFECDLLGVEGKQNKFPASVFQLRQTKKLSIKKVGEPDQLHTLEDSQQVYFVDQNGYLLDHEKQYLLNKGMIIRLSDRHLLELRKHGIMQ